MSSPTANQVSPVLHAFNQPVIELLDSAIADFIIQPEAPLNFDKWIVVSNLHKSIRHGEVISALKSTQSLLDTDPKYLFRRLPILAFEEVGIANYDLCSFSLIAANKRVQDAFGQARLAYFLVTKLAESIKSRLATDIYCLTVSDPDAKCYMKSCLNTPAQNLASIALDTSLSLTHRMTAIKLITGFSERLSNGYYGVISKPRLDLLEQICEAMTLSPEQQNLVMLGNGKTDALNGAMLLAIEMLSDSSNALVLDHEVPNTKSHGVNLSALDIYCRSGRAVISEFVATSKLLHQYFRQHPNKNPARLVGTVLFVIEGSLLNRSLYFTAQQELKDQIEYMELQAAGINSKSEAAKLIGIIRLEMPLLNDIRISHLETQSAT